MLCHDGETQDRCTHSKKATCTCLIWLPSCQGWSQRSTWGSCWKGSLQSRFQWQWAPKLAYTSALSLSIPNLLVSTALGDTSLRLVDVNLFHCALVCAGWCPFFFSNVFCASRSWCQLWCQPLLIPCLLWLALTLHEAWMSKLCWLLGWEWLWTCILRQVKCEDGRCGHVFWLISLDRS